MSDLNALLEQLVSDPDLSDLDLSELENLEIATNLTPILENRGLRWLFVGGKGGVGKTTVSSSLALALSRHRRRVLLISTDPAHNLSDIFHRKFTSEPMPLAEIPNLFVMEVDAEEKHRELPDIEMLPKGFLEDLGGSIPGIDEVSVFVEIMKRVKKMDFETIVFDTAPTGHTLRLLSFPTLLKTSYSKYFSLMQGVTKLLSVSADQVEDTRALLDEAISQFQDAEKTSFVCVCIPSFLSLYETERLVQDLMKMSIDCHSIVINQVVPDSVTCSFCRSRHRIQKKYIDQIIEMYRGFSIVQIPLFEEEITTVEKIQLLGPFLFPDEPERMTQAEGEEGEEEEGEESSEEIIEILGDD